MKKVFIDMKKTFMFVALVVLATFAGAKEKSGVVYDAVLTRIIDGDTVAFEAKWLPDPLKKELKIRVYGVDTPEKGWRAKCPKEEAMGQKASAFTKKMINNSKKRQIVLFDWDKFGGRVLGDVLLDGQSLREALIANGYARPYFGDKKQSWCN